MIKKIKAIFESYMIRPMIYMCVTKISVAVVLSMLWNYWFNKDGYFSFVEHAFFVVAVFFLMLAWFQYLRLDGITMERLFGPKKKKKKKENRHKEKDIADFADEKIISFAELEDDERMVCRLLTDLICFILFLIPSLIAAIIVS